MIKKVNFDFFKVNIPADVPAFESLLESINEIEGKERTYEGERYHMRLQSIKETTQGNIIGEMAKIRMTGIPEKMKLSGETDEIDLDDDQGLGEAAAFIYVPNIEILVYQKNRDSVSSSAFSTYVTEMSELDDEINFDFILEEEALQRLAQLDVVRSFQFQFAGPTNAEVFKELDLTPDSLIELMGTAPKAKASFTFSMGHQREGSISTKTVRAISRRFQKYAFDRESPNEKFKLLVSGKEEIDTETEVIDLFNGRMIETIEINSGESRVIPHKELKKAALEAWKNRKKELTKMFQEE